MAESMRREGANFQDALAEVSAKAGQSVRPSTRKMYAVSLEVWTESFEHIAREVRIALQKGFLPQAGPGAAR